MLRGLWRLTWLEIKIFVREPLGVIGSVAIPVMIFVVAGHATATPPRGDVVLPRPLSDDVPILASMLIAVSAVQSLVAIIAIYREGGILKRLRATPLRPHTILTAHVLVKLLFTAVTLALMVLVGRRVYTVAPTAPLSFAVALLFATTSLVSLGFLIASVVPTARFAQPISTLILYPMLAVSGLFVPVEILPSALQTLARVLPFSYAVSLLRGVWYGAGWLPHVSDVLALTLMFVVFTALSAKVFRWE